MSKNLEDNVKVLLGVSPYAGNIVAHDSYSRYSLVLELEQKYGKEAVDKMRAKVERENK